MSYMVLRVAEDVTTAICLVAVASAAVSRKHEGHRYVTISSELPSRYSRDARKRHFLESPSNFRPFELAHTIRATFPKQSLRTQDVAAATPSIHVSAEGKQLN